MGTKGLCGFASAAAARVAAAYLRLRVLVRLWGNIGAVAWGMMFKFGYIGNFEQGYIAMGYIIIASSVFTIFMRIKGQSSVLCGDQ